MFRSVIMSPKVTWHDIQGHMIIEQWIEYVIYIFLVRKSYHRNRVHGLMYFTFQELGNELNMLFGFSDPENHILDTKITSLWYIVPEKNEHAWFVGPLERHLEYLDTARVCKVTPSFLLKPGDLLKTPGIFVSFRSPRDKFFKHLLLHYKLWRIIRLRFYSWFSSSNYHWIFPLHGLFWHVRSTGDCRLMFMSSRSCMIISMFPSSCHAAFSYV